MGKQLLYLLLVLMPLISFSQATQPAQKKAPAKEATVRSAPKVYICEGGSAYAYHSSPSCSGLNRCTHTVSAVTRSEAENIHSRRPCKKCY